MQDIEFVCDSLPARSACAASQLPYGPTTDGAIILSIDALSSRGIGGANCLRTVMYWMPSLGVRWRPQTLGPKMIRRQNQTQDEVAAPDLLGQRYVADALWAILAEGPEGGPGLPLSSQTHTG